MVWHRGPNQGLPGVSARSANTRFKDEGVSGETLNRPALEALREQIEQGFVTTVICLDPDRLSRKLLHQLLLTEEWERLGGLISPL